MLDISHLKRGDPFDIPENPDELELMIGWFFDQIRVIVSIENHLLKFDGVQQLLDILQEAAETEKVNVRFYHADGQWFLDHAETKEDILKLPLVAKRFSRIYRFHADEYSHDDHESLTQLMGDVE